MYARFPHSDPLFLFSCSTFSADGEEEEDGLSENGSSQKRKLDEMLDGGTKKSVIPVILYHDGTNGIAKVLMTEDPVLGNLYYDQYVDFERSVRFS